MTIPHYKPPSIIGSTILPEIFTVEKINTGDVDLDAKNDVDVNNDVQYIHNTIFI